MVHPQHLVTVLGLLLRLLHQRVLVAARVQLSQELRIYELLRLEKTNKQTNKRCFDMKVLPLIGGPHVESVGSGLTLLIMRCMIVLGIRSRTVLLTMAM